MCIHIYIHTHICIYMYITFFYSSMVTSFPINNGCAPVAGLRNHGSIFTVYKAQCHKLCPLDPKSFWWWNILLMQEILHHLGCIKPVSNGTNYQPQLVQDFWTINSSGDLWSILSMFCMTSMGLVLKSWPRTAAQVLMGAAACRLVMLDHPQAEMSKELIHLPIAIQDTKVVQYMWDFCTVIPFQICKALFVSISYLRAVYKLQLHDNLRSIAK